MRLVDQSCAVDKYPNGEIDIRIYDAPPEILKEIAKFTKQKIHEYDGTRWIKFSRARDKSRLTIFEA